MRVEQRLLQKRVRKLRWIKGEHDLLIAMMDMPATVRDFHPLYKNKMKLRFKSNCMILNQKMSLKGVKKLYLSQLDLQTTSPASHPTSWHK